MTEPQPLWTQRSRVRPSLIRHHLIVVLAVYAVVTDAVANEFDREPTRERERERLNVRIVPSGTPIHRKNFRAIAIKVDSGTLTSTDLNECVATVVSSDPKRPSIVDVRVLPNGCSSARCWVGASPQRINKRNVSFDTLVVSSASSTTVWRPRGLFNPLVDKLAVRTKVKRRGVQVGYHIAVRCIDTNGDLRLGTAGFRVPYDNGIDDFIMAPPAPGRPGGWKVCTHDYDLAEKNPDQWGFARIYAPVFSTNPCSTFGKFDLVIIAHADFIPGSMLENSHLFYEGLARHLASNAFMVVSINRYLSQNSDGENFNSVLKAHLDFLYGPNSPIKGLITDTVALIGHSAGGRASIRHVQVIEELGKNAVALVTIAPTIDVNDDKTFIGDIDALLGLHGTHDMDQAAFGDKAVGLPMKSTFKIYDDAGLMPGNANLLGLTKDMIFIKGYGHYVQNTIIALAYINAFFQTHLHLYSIYNRFLKFQQRVPSLGKEVLWQQHADKQRLVLADFENGSADMNTLGGDIVVSDDGISNVTVDEAHVIDNYSPHHTNVIKFDLDPDGNPNFVTFGFDKVTNLTSYRHMSLRATQVYDPNLNNDGSPLDFEITLADFNNVESTVSIADFGGLLHFPVFAEAPVNIESQTKNAMRSYLLLLGAFQGIDLSKVISVKISFPFDEVMHTTLIFDDIEFYK